MLILKKILIFRLLRFTLNVLNVVDPLPNYKIPKKTSSDSNDVQNYATPLNWGPPVTNIDSPGLTGSWGQQNDNSRNDSPLVTYNFSAYKKPPEKEVPKNVNVNKRPCKLFI